MRFLAGLVASGLVCGAAVMPVSSTGATAAPVQDPDAASTCGMCHVEIHREWQGSAHAQAWNDPIYQKALKGREKAHLCHPCHIPDSALERLGQKPRTRTSHLDEGVTCIACHKQADALHGPFDLKTDAHPTVRDPSFVARESVALCSGCHDLRIADVLPVAKEFMASGLPAQGKTCTGCHMPAVERPLAIAPATGKPAGEARKGRSHALLGPGNAEFCKRAFEFAVDVAADKLTLHVRNKAGHGVPGLVRQRSFPMVFTQLDAAGKVLDTRRFTVSSDNRLLVEEDRRVELVRKPGAVALSVEVDHVFMGKTVATLVQQRLELE
jgi:Cytochrome c554 and c-prime